MHALNFIYIYIVRIHIQIREREREMGVRLYLYRLLFRHSSIECKSVNFKPLNHICIRDMCVHIFHFYFFTFSINKFLKYLYNNDL